MLFDSHMHTQFSSDSQMKLEEAIARARELHMGITITEHMDLSYPGPLAFIFDVEQYFAQYGPYRSDEVLLGIEIGLREDCLEDNCRIMEKHPFDFVLGSVHVVDNTDIYLAEFYEGRSKQEVYRQYFEAMRRCAECYTGIHSLGHIDYICRYARFDDPEIYYHEFAEQIDAVLKVLAEKGKAIEINTRRLGSPTAKAALLPIYRRFAELGGTLATIGSDAHRPADIGRDMAAGIEIAQAAGLQPVYFKQGQPIAF